LSVAENAVVLLDDGKGRRLSVKHGKLADVPVGSMVNARLSVSQPTVMQLRAEGPIVMGLIKSVDVNQRTLTIAIPKGRGEAEEKTYTVPQDARISMDGAASDLANLKPGNNGPIVMLRLSLDQQVRMITARQATGR
jgi:hypothetical protein